jgi:tetratricopeptide (TPR) repeat protein
VALLSFVAILATTAPALADGARDEAKALTEKAQIEYNVGHFQQALELYSQAYEAVPSPALLFDIGQCHKMLKNYERALFSFRGYLREQPAAPNRSLVEQLIAESQSALDAQRAAEAQQRAASVGASPPGAVTTERPSTAAVSPPPSSSPSPSPSPSAESSAPERGGPALRIAGLVTAGAGVVLVGTGVYFGLHAGSISNELSRLASSHGTWSDQYQSDYDSGKSSAQVANVLYVVGAVALVAGGVLTYLGWPTRRAPVTAAVAPAPGGGSLAVAGRF